MIFLGPLLPFRPFIYIKRILQWSYVWKGLQGSKEGRRANRWELGFVDSDSFFPELIVEIVTGARVCGIGAAAAAYMAPTRE